MRSVDDYLEEAIHYHTNLHIIDNNSSGRTSDPFHDESMNNDSYHRANISCCPKAIDRWRYTFLFVCLGIANISDAAEILCLSYILSDPIFFTTMIGQDAAFRSGLVAAMVFLGMLLGGLVVGCLGDWYGRRPLLQIGLITCSITGTLSALCPDIITLVVCRFIAGIGIGATVPPLFALCTELAPPSYRGYYISIVASFWMIGSIYVAIVGWIILGNSNNTTNENETTNDTSNLLSGLSAWRIFAMVCAIPSAVGSILIHRFVPESPRFLLLQHRYDEALSVLQYLTITCLHYHGPSITLDELHYSYPQQQQQQGQQGNITNITTSFPAVITTTTASTTTSEIGQEWTAVRFPGPTSAYSRNSSNDRNDPELDDSIRSSGMFDPNRTDIDPLFASSSAGRRNSSIQLMQPTSLSIASKLQLAFTEFTLSSSKLYTPKLRGTTYPLQIIWFTLSFGSYGLLTWINKLFVQVHLHNVYFNALLFSLSNLPGNLVSVYCMDRFGRTRLLSTSLLLAAFSLVAFAYEAAIDDDDDNNDTASNHNKMLIVTSACLFQCFTIAAWNAVDVLSSELFPTSVRATGMGVCAATGRIGAMVAQFINGWLVSEPTRLLLVAAGTLILGSILPSYLPADQSGQPIHDYTDDDLNGSNPSSESASVTSQRIRLHNRNNQTVDEIDGGNDDASELQELASSSSGINENDTGDTSTGARITSYQQTTLANPTASPMVLSSRRKVKEEVAARNNFDIKRRTENIDNKYHDVISVRS